jgi:DNA-nicking Smr family endonuclease
MSNPTDFDPEDHDPVELPVDGTLDLHAFHPREAGDLVREYVAACRERGILEVRIVHGKGIGALRRTVHAVLERMPEVESFRLAGEDRGSWGATLVVVRPPHPPQEPGSGSPDPSQSRGTR